MRLAQFQVAKTPDIWDLQWPNSLPGGMPGNCPPEGPLATRICFVNSSDSVPRKVGLRHVTTAMNTEFIL